MAAKEDWIKMPPLTRGGKRVATDQPGQLLLYYPDGSYKIPERNPLGTARAGARVVKCGVNVDASGISKMHHFYNISLPWESGLHWPTL